MDEEEVLGKIINILKNSNYRVTPQLKEILKVLYKNKEKYLAVEEIYQIVKQALPGIGVSTVYKAVMKFDKIGILYRILIYGDCSKYRLILPGEKSKYQHFICEQCGKIFDIDQNKFADTKNFIENKYGVLIKDQSTIYYGICKKCSHN